MKKAGLVGIVSGLLLAGSLTLGGCASSRPNIEVETQHKGREEIKVEERLIELWNDPETGEYNENMREITLGGERWIIARPPRSEIPEEIDAQALFNIQETITYYDKGHASYQYRLRDVYKIYSDEEKFQDYTKKVLIRITNELSAGYACGYVVSDRIKEVSIFPVYQFKIFDFDFDEETKTVKVYDHCACCLNEEIMTKSPIHTGFSCPLDYQLEGKPLYQIINEYFCSNFDSCPEPINIQELNLNNLLDRDVYLMLNINEEGNVVNSKALYYIPSDNISNLEYMVEVSKQIKFSPATKEGELVASKYILKYEN